jgi:hypothetical protein
MAQTSGSNVYRIPRRFNWPFVIGGFAFLSLAIMLWRWGGTVEDSLAYFDTARWVRGEIPLQDLRSPFPYRLAVPALAALLPGDIHNTFAALNWIFVTATACLATASVRRMGFGTQRALGAGLLVVLSLPTFWYAPYLLVDPGAVCMRMLFVFAVLTGQPRLALAAGLAATAIREENILLLGWLLVMRRVAVPQGLAALAAAAAWLVAVRWWIVPGLPHDTWVPNLGTVRALLDDRRSLLSLLGCAGVVLPLALAGMRRAPPSRAAERPARADGPAAAVCRAERACGRARRVEPVSVPRPVCRGAGPAAASRVPAGRAAAQDVAPRLITCTSR